MSTTKEQVKKLADKGLTARQIAAVLHISTQAVYQHLAKLREEASV